MASESSTGLRLTFPSITLELPPLPTAVAEMTAEDREHVPTLVSAANATLRALSTGGRVVRTPRGFGVQVAARKEPDAC